MHQYKNYKDYTKIKRALRQKVIKMKGNIKMKFIYQKDTLCVCLYTNYKWSLRQKDIKEKCSMTK